MAKDKMDMMQDKKMAKKAIGMHDKQMHGGKKTDLAKLKKGGMCSGGKAKKYEGGGAVTPAQKAATKPAPKPAPKEPVPSEIADKLQDMKNEKAYQNYEKTKKLARGGGIEVRGKTKGKVC
jgi:hypothetical protein